MHLALRMDHGSLMGSFLSIKKWDPNFVAFEVDETYSAIWRRLPELPTKYYCHTILAKFGQSLLDW